MWEVAPIRLDQQPATFRFWADDGYASVCTTRTVVGAEAVLGIATVFGRTESELLVTVSSSSWITPRK